MDAQINLPTLLIFSAILFAAIGVYQSVMRRIIEAGGLVRAAEFQLADLLTAVVLAGLFTINVFLSLLHSDAPAPLPNSDGILPTAVYMLILVAGIAGFLRLRNIDLWRLFGFDRVSRGRAMATGLGLILAAFPIIVAVASLSQKLLDTGTHEQELVTLFRDVTRKSDTATMAKIILAGVVIAPITEEFLFRGYFYGALKRYSGGFVSAVFVSALFAAIHLNLASAPSLFILALCLTIAYESTGCILVPVTMHALFNLGQLVFLFVNARAHIG